MYRLFTRLILTALAVSPALADFHLMGALHTVKYIDDDSNALIADDSNSVIAVPSNQFNCKSMSQSPDFLYEDGRFLPYESDFFNSGGPVCGVVINFYGTTEEGAGYKMYEEGGGFLGYCYPQWGRELIFCDSSLRATDDYVCYSYVCE